MLHIVNFIICQWFFIIIVNCRLANRWLIWVWGQATTCSWPPTLPGKTERPKGHWNIHDRQNAGKGKTKRSKTQSQRTKQVTTPFFQIMMVTLIERRPKIHSHDVDYDSLVTNLQRGSSLLQHNIEPTCIVAVAAAVFAFICNLINPVHEGFTMKLF